MKPPKDDCWSEAQTCMIFLINFQHDYWIIELQPINFVQISEVCISPKVTVDQSALTDSIGTILYQILILRKSQRKYHFIVGISNSNTTGYFRIGLWYMMVDLMNIYIVNTKLLPQLCNEDDDNELIFSITLWCTVWKKRKVTLNL